MTVDALNSAAQKSVDIQKNSNYFNPSTSFSTPKSHEKSFPESAGSPAHQQLQHGKPTKGMSIIVEPAREREEESCGSPRIPASASFPPNVAQNQPSVFARELTNDQDVFSRCSVCCCVIRQVIHIFIYLHFSQT